MTKIADQTVILIRKADARVLAVLVVHQEVVHLRQVVHQGVQAPVLVHHAPVLVTKRVRLFFDLFADFLFLNKQRSTVHVRINHVGA